MVNEYEEVVLGVHDDVVPRQDDSELPSLTVCFTIAQQHQRLIYVFFKISDGPFSLRRLEPLNTTNSRVSIAVIQLFHTLLTVKFSTLGI